MQIKDVIVLGAGASASEGAPMQSKLFHEFFAHPSIGHQDNRITERLRRFFRDFFGIDIDNDLIDANFPTFEEILGILEQAVDRGESFKNYSVTQDSPEVQAVRQDMIFLIALILKEKLQRTCQHHLHLVRRLKNSGKLRKTAFISLNYDILIDNALVDLYETDDIHLDYSVDFTNFYYKGGWKKPNKNKEVRLYKLHGSLNWLYCPTCVSLTLTPKEKRVATLIHSPEPCRACRTNMIPIIIPPTFFKVMSNYYLQQIWRNAEKTLMGVNRIFFCGYSFPDADIHIKYLFKRVEMNSGSVPTEIYIINNHENKSDEQKEQENQRYLRFFSRKENIHYLARSFEEFCTDGI